MITINWGGFDTHGDQISTQDPQLVELSQCLGAFQADLATRGIDGQVATLMFSEFGRRVQDNASGGTDHGAGRPDDGARDQRARRLRGAEFPGLSTLDDSGNLLVPTDFRSVYRRRSRAGSAATRPPCCPEARSPAISRYDSGTGLFDDPSGLFT